MVKIFIGFDSNQVLDYVLLEQSLIRFSSQPLMITPLCLDHFSFYKESHQDGSTEFSYSRFLVPYLTSYQGWALYMDSDMICCSDIKDLWSRRNSKYALHVVKHDYQTSQSIKMQGHQNNNYPRKNWSSLMLINCQHPSLRILTPSLIEKSQGQYLHQFNFVDDDLIAHLPLEWNWLADEYGHNDNAKIIHYTLGSPRLAEYATTPMAIHWHKELNFLIENDNKKIKELIN